jgi:hypothetical protein
VSNIGRALRRLYFGTRAPSPTFTGSPAAFEQVTRQMVEDIKADIRDIKTVQQWTFALIAGTVIAEILRSLLK